MRSARLSRAGLSSLLVACAACSSEADWECDRSGFTIGGGGAYGIENFDVHDTEADLNTNIVVGNARGYEGRVGYRFTPNFAIEGVYQYLNDFEFDVNGNSIGNVVGIAGTLNAKGYVLTGPVQPYVFAGAGALRFGFRHHVAGLFEDATEFMARAGIGADVYLARHILLYVEGAYNMPAANLEDFQYTTVTAGLQYRF